MKSKTPFKNVFVISVVATLFVAVIAWGGFHDVLRVEIACAITFVVVFVSIYLLKVVQKDDPDVKPGQPRLK
jgi:energy-converting hydrogenase Eha subunit C